MSDLPDDARTYQWGNTPVDLANRVQFMLAEAATNYRDRNHLDRDAKINVLAPAWAVDLYREAFDGVPHVVIEPYDDAPPPTVNDTIAAARDHFTLYLHAGIHRGISGALDIGVTS